MYRLLLHIIIKMYKSQIVCTENSSIKTEKVNYLITTINL